MTQLVSNCQTESPAQSVTLSVCGCWKTLGPFWPDPPLERETVFEHAGLVAASAKSPLNFGFLIVIAVVTAAAVIGFFTKGALRRLADQAPALLTGLGLLGTFSGIFVSLLAFDVSSAAAIHRGVPLLLEGMKTAFLTSVAGLGAALGVRLSAALITARESAEATNVVDVVDAIDRMRGELVSEIKSLRAAVVGEADTSLVNQIRSLRDENREHIKWVRDALDRIATSLAESATKALISALENAIKDFNSKITEQFGHNFARLNDAVGKLLEWQEGYRVQLEELVSHYRAAADSARASAEALQLTAEQAKALVTAAERAEQTLGALEALRSEIAAGLGHFAETGRQAGETVPKLEASLTEILQRTRSTADLVAETARRMEHAVAQTGQTMEDATQRLAERQRSLLEMFETQSKDLLARTANHIETAARSQLERIYAELQSIQRAANESIDKTFRTLDDALQRELTHALEALGSRLAAVTNAFAQDFSQAIANLRAAAQAAQRGTGATVR